MLDKVIEPRTSGCYDYAVNDAEGGLGEGTDAKTTPTRPPPGPTSGVQGGAQLPRIFNV